MTEAEIISRLANPNFVLRQDEDGNWAIQPRRQPVILPEVVTRLVDEGWITRTRMNLCELTDEGRIQFLKSTDEMGSGELISPKTEDSNMTWHPAEYKVKEQMYLGEISDQQEIIQKLLDVIREVYALNGEDPEINRICNSALEQFSG